MSEAADCRYDPSSYTDVLADAGDGIAVPCGDRVYRLGFPTQKQKARYEQYLVAHELKLVKLQKRLLEPAEYTARMDLLAEQIEQRAFATGGAKWLQHSATAAGWMMWVRALFAENHPDITAAEVERMAAESPDEVRVALKQVIPPFVRWVVRQVAELAAKAGDPELGKRVQQEATKLEATLGEFR